MKKIISFTVISLAILTPNIALSQGFLSDYSEDESELIVSLICKDKGFSREEILEKMDAEAGDSISDERLEEMTNVAMSGKQMPRPEKRKLCRGNR
ncbi:MAG: hypothetical protein AAGA80_08485 [Cyanobacteria bacterium P01_F01_bin.143]